MNSGFQHIQDENETKEIIKKKDIHEIKKTAQDTKKEFNKDIESLRKRIK
jgi:hypothetical protein